MEKIGTLAWFNIFAEVEKKLKEENKSEWCIVMNSWMFVTQRHKCYTWEQYRRKSKHNKDAKRLREHFNRTDLS